MKGFKELVNEAITERARYGKVLSVRFNLQHIVQYLREEKIQVTPSQNKKLQKLVIRNKNAVSIRQLMRALGRRGDKYQIKNQLIKQGVHVKGVQLGTFVTLLV